MDVLPGALPESFFLEASDECFQCLGKLIDVGIAQCIERYKQSPDSNPAVVRIINEKLGEAIKHATYHLTLRESGVLEFVNNFNLDIISHYGEVPTSCATQVQEMRNIMKTIEEIFDNRQYIHATIAPRKKDDFDAFWHYAPDKYKSQITANRRYFYMPHQKEYGTGLNRLMSRLTDMTILYRGLEARLNVYNSSYGSGGWDTLVERFC